VGWGGESVSFEIGGGWGEGKRRMRTDGQATGTDESGERCRDKKEAITSYEMGTMIGGCEKRQ